MTVSVSEANILTESTTSKMPSTIFSIRSTSPPKSACPGVSTKLYLVSLYLMAQFWVQGRKCDGANLNTERDEKLYAIIACNVPNTLMQSVQDSENRFGTEELRALWTSWIRASNSPVQLFVRYSVNAIFASSRLKVRHLTLARIVIPLSRSWSLLSMTLTPIWGHGNDEQNTRWELTRLKIFRSKVDPIRVDLTKR